jgi:TonB-linked SusC/RagA family outer membrane protein
VGQEIQSTNSRLVEAEGKGLSNVFFGQQGNIISGTLTTQNIYGDLSNNRLQSVFGRINYAFEDKYLVSASLRNDKLSALPWSSQGSTMPGASVGWRVSKEEFWQKGKINNIINDLKIRASWATVGNTNIGDFPYAGLFSPVYYGTWNGAFYSNMGNTNLKFETSKKMDIGLDIAFLKNRIQFTGDYFSDLIDNLILNVPTAPSLGVPTPQGGAPENSYPANVGRMTNKGWEFTINSLNIDHTNFKWSTSLNISFVRNRVTALMNNQSIINAYNITEVGQPIGSFYGYHFYGVNTENGNPIWYKADGSLVQYDGSIDKYSVYDPQNPADESTSSTLSAADKKVMGNANPTWFGGMNNTFTYKNFDLGILFTFSGGNRVYNQTRQETLMNLQFGNNSTEILKRWTTQGQKTSVPKLYYNEFTNILQQGNMDSRFLENGSFLRLQTLSLGYSLPTSLLSHVWINSLRVYVQAQNLFVVTKYTGFDPELANSVTANQTPGLDYNVNPIPRTFTFGINLNF